jgi:hypothetical protein
VTARTHHCPDCGQPTEITFEASDSNYMILEGEFVGLSDLACRIYCACGWALPGVLHDAVIDLHAWTVTAGQFVANDRAP